MNTYPSGLPDISNSYPKQANNGLLWLCRVITPEIKRSIDHSTPGKLFLGSGSKGVAYLWDGSVVKLTPCQKEKEIAEAFLNRRRSPCVVDVFYLSTIADRFYRIDLEMVKHLPELLGKVFCGGWHYVFVKNEDEDAVLERLRYLKEDKEQVRCELLKLYKLKKRLLRCKLNLVDLRKENVGLRNGEIVILDLGCIKRYEKENQQPLPTH